MIVKTPFFITKKQKRLKTFKLTSPQKGRAHTNYYQSNELLLKLNLIE